MFLLNTVYDIHIFNKVSFVICDFHTLTAKYIARSYKYRVTKFFAYCDCFHCSKHSLALRSCQIQTCQNIVKYFPVLCCIDIFWLCTNNVISCIANCFCKFDCCLSAKLNYNAYRFFDSQNIQGFFHCQWLKIQPVRSIKVSRYSLRIVVDNNSSVSCFS